jgi:hypothetical protein
VAPPYLESTIDRGSVRSSSPIWYRQRPQPSLVRSGACHNVNLLHIPAEASFPRRRLRASGGQWGTMADYRAYLVGSDGHFYEAVALVCADDAEAIQKAKKLVDHREVELWQLDRKVATFKSRSIE